MQNILFGIVTGSIILLGAVGFSMTQKSDGFVNVAHGQMLMLGAYIAFFFNQLGLNLVFAAVLSLLLTGLVGLGLYRLVFMPVKAKGKLVLLFTSVGLAYVINGLVGAAAGSRIQSYVLPEVQAISIGSFRTITPYALLIVVLSVLSTMVLHLFLARTRFGKMIRAVADNFDLARVRGVNPTTTSNYVWFIASAMAALAGVFSGVLGTLYIDMGWYQFLVILSATVLGGLGSVYGVMAASFIIGMGMELGILVLPSHYRSAIAFAIIIVVLILRPEGLQSLWRPAGRGRPA